MPRTMPPPSPMPSSLASRLRAVPGRVTPRVSAPPAVAVRGAGALPPAVVIRGAGAPVPPPMPVRRPPPPPLASAPPPPSSSGSSLPPAESMSPQNGAFAKGGAVGKVAVREHTRSLPKREAQRDDTPSRDDTRRKPEKNNWRKHGW